jgi:hypothetical protein
LYSQKLTIDSLDNLPANLGLNVYEIYKYFKPEYQDWLNISERHLRLMIVRYKNQIEFSAMNKSKYSLSNNYKHLILSYIHINQHLNSNEFSLNDAINFAKEWVRNFKNEPDSYYYLGTLQLLKGIQNNDDLKSLKDAKSNLNECKTMYENMREPSAPKKVNYVEFLIGNQPGLRGLNIFDDHADLSNLRKYEGYIENDNGKIYIEFKGLKVKCLDRNALDDASKIKKAEQGQMLKCSYHIAIRRLGCLAYKFERLERLENE